jgi:hypothetical protein
VLFAVAMHSNQWPGKKNEQQPSRIDMTKSMTRISGIEEHAMEAWKIKLDQDQARSSSIMINEDRMD